VPALLPSESVEALREQEAVSQRARFDEVGEGPLAVDLHDGQMLPMRRLELRIALNVHHPELEPELGPCLAENL
jgi:hypothetical protein